MELLDIHGGSIRMWARPSGTVGPDDVSDRVREVMATEEAAGLHDVGGYSGFASAVSRVRDDLVEFLIEARRQGRTVVGYGAPGKGNTLRNFCGIRPDLLPAVHGRPQTLQARQADAGHADPGLPAREHRGRSARLPAGPAVQPA